MDYIIRREYINRRYILINIDIRNRFVKRIRVLTAPSDLIEDTILHCCNGTEEKIIIKDIISKLSLWLDPINYQIIKMRYLNESKMTFKAIGQYLNISESGVWQRHKEAIKILRKVVDVI